MNLILLILSFLFSFFGTFFVKLIANKNNILDIPNTRSSHIRPTPRGGGLAISFTWFIALFLGYFFYQIPKHLFFSLLCGIPIAIVGIMDDIVSVSPRFRFLIQVICASLAVIFIGGISAIDLGFHVVYIKFIFSLIAVIGIIWYTNLFNFLDGIDGYISSEIIFVCLASFALFGFELPLLLGAATAGFLIWNWQPAKIFMGDVGSTLLGFTIGIFAIYSPNMEPPAILIWLMITSLFWFDATLTLFRRWRNKEKLSVAHKKHGYQRIVQYGYSHQKTVILSILINIPIFILALLAKSFPNFLLPFFAINLAYLYFIMRQVDRRFSFNKL